MVTGTMANASDLELPDLLAGIVEDSRDLVEAQLGSLRADLGDRVTELGVAIKSWLIALTVAIATLLLLGLAIATTIHELGLGWMASLWTVTALAGVAVGALAHRARATSRAATTLTLNPDAATRSAAILTTQSPDEET
jgi:hypothetical protein